MVGPGTEWIVKDAAGLEHVAAAVCADLSHFKVFLLNGPMGSGKTTLMRYVGKKLGIIGDVSSPTFSLVNEYHIAEPGPGGIDRIFHMDLYRLEHPDELFEIGFVEYLESGMPVFIEWPEIACSWYDGTEGLVDIRIMEDGSRKIRILPFIAFDEHTWVTK